MVPILNWPDALALIELIARTARAQKAADSASEDRNAAACLVKDSGYWNREPCPASGYVSKTALARFSLNRWELETGIISSWTPFYRVVLPRTRQSSKAAAHPLRDDRLELGRSLLPEA